MENYAPACWMHVYLSPGWGLGHTEPLCHLFEPVFPRGSRSYSAQCFVSDSIVGARLTRKGGWPREERLGKIEKRERDREIETGKKFFEVWVGRNGSKCSMVTCSLCPAECPGLIKLISRGQSKCLLYSATWTYSNQQTIHCHQYFQTTLPFHPSLLCASLQAKIDMWTSCRTLFWTLAITEHMPTYDREAINVGCRLPQYNLVL